MSIMVRAEITNAEWNALRKLAIDKGKTNQGIIGSVLRDYLRANGYEEGEETDESRTA